jgi:predicted nucleic-acid-binding protein
MTGLDTNILVRYFTKDDLVQGSKASLLIRNLTLESPGYVSLVALIELVWVLRSRYRLSKADLIRHLELLVDSPELIVESQTAVAMALRRFAVFKADFTDCLIERLGASAGCAETVTFDVDASRFAGMRLI